MPSEWPWVPFERLLVEPVRNGIYKPKDFHGRGAKIVNMGELFAHPRLRSVPMKRVELSDSERQRFALSKGDLLFARRSLVAEGAGKCSVVLDVDEPTTFESSIIRARPDRKKAEPSTCTTSFLQSSFALPRYHSSSGCGGWDHRKRSWPVTDPGSAAPRTTRHRPHPRHPRRQDRAEPPDERDCGGHRTGALQVLVRGLRPGAREGGGADTGLPREIADLFPDGFEESELGDTPMGWPLGTLADFAMLNPEVLSTDTRPGIIRYVDLSQHEMGHIEAVTDFARKTHPAARSESFASVTQS